MKKSIFLLLALFLMSINIFAEIPEIDWTPVGLGGGGGQFTPAISPVDQNLMFVSCDMSGVYRTTDGGKSWSMINFRQLKSSIAIPTVFHPSDINIMWDDNRRNLKKSTDRGITWNTVWEMPESPLDIFIPSGTNSFVMFVAFGSGGLYKSTNGNDFTKVNNIDNAEYISGNKNIIVASGDKVWLSEDEGNSFSLLGENTQINQIQGVGVRGNNIYVMDSHQLWKSTNKGENWESKLRAADYDRGNFTFIRASQSYVWVATSGGGKYQSTVFLSKENGDAFAPVFFCNSSWDDTRNLESGWLSLDFNCGWGGAAIGFNIASDNPDIALWTDYGRTLMTTNGGVTWEAVYTSYADEGERAAGKRWKSRGLEVTSSWDIYIPQNNNKFVNVAYTDIGGAYSEDGGDTWRSTYDGGIPGEWHNTTYDFAYDAENKLLWGAFSGRHDIPGGWSANLWSNEGKGGVAYSTDGGMYWTPLTEHGLINKPVTSIAIDFTSPVDNRRLYAAVWSDGVWRSENSGQSWERVSNGLDCGDGTNSSDGPNTHVVDVQVAADGTVYVLKTKYIRDGYKIKNDAGLWRSNDYGNSWKFISSNVPECPPNTNIDLNGEHSWADAISFTLDENDGNHIYVGAQNVNNGKVQGGLYETTDGGENWKRIYQTYAAFRITLSKHYPDRLYLATTGEGILISDDKAETWTEIANFPFVHPTRIREDPLNDNIIWVNTFGGGVWKGELSGQTDVYNPEETVESAITPNPAGDYIDISTSAVMLNEVKHPVIKIYDVLGVCVLTLPCHSCESRNLSGGEEIPNQVGNDSTLLRLDVSGLAAGVYFIRIGGQVLKFVKM